MKNYRPLGLRLLLSIAPALLFYASSFGQTYTQDFSTSPNIYALSSGNPAWFNYADFTLNGVAYQMTNNVNGAWEWKSSGGNNNTGCLYFSTGSYQMISIKRKDGFAFGFYGLYLNYTSSTTQNATVSYRYAGKTNPIADVLLPANGTQTLVQDGLPVTEVVITLPSLLTLKLDDFKIGPPNYYYAPDITTTTTEFTDNSINLAGTVTNDGGKPITEAGIYYSTTSPVTTSSNKLIIPYSTSVFSKNVTGLNANTTYYIKAYATNAIGTTFGLETPVTTASNFTLVGTHYFNGSWLTTNSQATPYTKYIEGWNFTGAAINSTSTISISRTSTNGDAVTNGVGVRVRCPLNNEGISSMGIKAKNDAPFDLEKFLFRYNLKWTNSTNSVAGSKLNNITVTGYRNGSPVPGAVATLTGLANSIDNTNYLTFDLTGKNQFNHIDEFRLTGSNPSAANSVLSEFTFDVLTAAAPDQTPPVVSSITRLTPISSVTKAGTLVYRVTFSEVVNNVDVSDFALTTTGTASGTIQSVSASSGKTIDVTVGSVTGQGTVRLDLNITGTGITDEPANAITTGYNSGEIYTLDRTLPTGQISSPSATYTTVGPVSYQITLADDHYKTSSLTNANVTLNTTGTATGTASVTGSGTTYTVTVNNTSGTGTIGISIAAGVAIDSADNTSLAFGPSATFKVCTVAGITSVTSPAGSAVCPGATTNLIANGVKGSNAAVTWYNQPDGIGNSLGIGSTLSGVASGVYYARVTAECGLPAESSITVTLKATSSSDTTVSACDNFSWNGKNYTLTGDYVFKTINAVGCDSIANLHLTIRNSTTSDDYADECDSFIWKGNSYYVTGNYQFKTTNATGCDSIITLHLNIRKSSTSHVYLSACDSLIWNGSTYNSTNNYVYKTTNAAGCDSTVTLHLTIKNRTTSDLYVNACNSYSWKGTSYTNSGDFDYRTTNAAGCDSIITLHLSLRTKPSVVDTAITACYSYTFKDSTYKRSGFYVYSTGNSGCDTIYNITLIITYLPTDFVAMDATCNRPSNGRIEVTALSGIAPLEYRLGTAGGYLTTNRFDSLKAGRYYVYVKDATGCIGLAGPITINEPAPFPVIALSAPTKCFGSGDGSITVTTPNTLPGNLNLYSIGTSGVYQSINVFSSLKPATYRVTVKDAAGCLSTATATVGQPAKVIAAAIADNSTCIAKPNGTITAYATGGTGYYVYRLGTAGTYAAKNVFTGIRASGSAYKVYVQDSKGCVAVPASAIVSQASNDCTVLPMFARQSPAPDFIVRSFDAAIAPNPSSGLFKLNVTGTATLPVSIRVIDLNGKTFYATKGFASQTYNFGETLMPGMYMVEVRQGDEVKMIKAVKTK